MKGIDWDKAREILEGCAGDRPMIDEMQRRFKEAGVYDVRLEDLENTLVRDIIHRLNREARNEGRFDEQFFNFTRVLETGAKEQYYEEFSKANAKELAQLATVEYRKANAQMRKFFDIHDRASERHGRRYTKLLPFAVPERPAQLSATAAD